MTRIGGTTLLIPDRSRVQVVSYINTVLEDNPAALWPFNEQYALPILHLAADAEAKMDGARQFTNATSEFLSHADHASLSPAGDFAIATWIYFDNTTGDQAVLGKWNEVGNLRQYQIIYDSGVDRIRFQVSNDGTAEITVDADTLGSPSTATWYFVVVSHDNGTDITIEINDGGSDSTAHTTGVNSSSALFLLGAEGVGATNNLDARVGRSLLYGRLLTAAEKTYLHANKSAYGSLGIAGTNGSNLKTNLVASWNLNEPQGGCAKDSHNAILYPTARQFIAADNTNLSLSDPVAFEPGDADVTLAGWVKLDSVGADRTLIGKFNATGDQREYRIYYDTVATRFAFQVSNDGTAEVTENADVLGVPAIDTWYFIVAWHDAAADTINIQINDGTADSSAHATGVNTGTADFIIGADGDGTSNSMDGPESQWAFWDRTLTAAEKTYLYNSGAGRLFSGIGVAATDGSALKTSLVSWWPLDEIGDTGYDAHAASHLTDNNTVTCAPGISTNAFHLTDGATVTAADGPGVTLASDGDFIEQWDDQSGNATNATETVAANMPMFRTNIVNSKLVVRFDGIIAVLDLGSPAHLDNIWDGGASLYTVLLPKSAGEGNNGVIWAKKTGAQVIRWNSEAGGNVKLRMPRDFDGTNGIFETSAEVVPVGSFSLLSVEYNADSVVNVPTMIMDGTALTVSVSTTPVGTRTSDASNSSHVGNSSAHTKTYDGDIPELVLFDRILPAADRQLAEGSLAHKYGKEADLPAGHPYLTTDPGGIFLTDGIVNDLIGSADGTAKNGVGINAASVCKSGTSFDFDGLNDISTIDDIAAVQNVLDGGGSLEFWMNIDTVGGGNLGNVINKGGVWLVQVEDPSGSFCKLTFRQTFDGASDGTWITTNRIIPTNENVHIVITYDNGAVGNNPTLYVQGVAYTVGSGLTESETPVGTRFTDVGSDLDQGNAAALNRGFDGKLDEIALYPTVLTADRVNAHLLAGNKPADNYVSKVLPDAPVGFWRFNEISGTSAEDSSVNSNTGTVDGSTTLNEATIVVTGGTAFLFNGGTDDVHVVDHASIQNPFDTGGSIEAWINPDSDGGGNVGRIIDKAVGWFLNVNSESGGNVAITFHVDFDGTDGTWDTAVDIPIGSITYIVVTYDSSAVGNNPIIYIDGVARTVGSGLTESSTPVGTRVTDVGSALYIGNSSAATVGFAGHIDEPTLYNTVLTQARVTAHYNAGT